MHAFVVSPSFALKRRELQPSNIELLIRIIIFWHCRVRFYASVRQPFLKQLYTTLYEIVNG